MTLDLAKIKSDAEIIASRCDTLLMPLPVKDVLGMLAEIEITETRLHDVAVLCATVEQERDQLKAENEALRKDAERYRAIRDEIPHADLGRAIINAQTAGEYDSAVDSAIDKDHP